MKVHIVTGHILKPRTDAEVCPSWVAGVYHSRERACDTLHILKSRTHRVWEKHISRKKREPREEYIERMQDAVKDLDISGWGTVFGRPHYTINTYTVD